MNKKSELLGGKVLGFQNVIEKRFIERVNAAAILQKRTICALTTMFLLTNVSTSSYHSCVLFLNGRNE